MSDPIQAVSTEPSPERKRRILIIEDDETLQSIFMKLFERIDPNTEISWATSAEHFLQLQEAHLLPPWDRYDLVVTDIFTPGTASGFDIWNHFAMKSPRTPVVMMSGMTQLDFFKSMGNTLIVPPFLEKPLDFTECRALIGGLLARGRAA